MSRNKDKYDSTNRRQQIFLSAEDIAAGKKTNWSGLEITGKLTYPTSHHISLIFQHFQAACGTLAPRCGNSSI